MIKKIAHRILNQNDLLSLPNDWGVEFDLHSYNDKLVVVHDAFSDGIKFEKFLEFVNGRFLAVNIKEEGIEKKVLHTLKIMNYSDFFLFDVSFPQIIKFAGEYSKNIALRLSQYEKLDLEVCRKYASYLWVDTFDGTFWLDEELLIYLKKLSYKLCFVSPDLHKPMLSSKEKFLEDLQKINSLLSNEDSICMKFCI